MPGEKGNFFFSDESYRYDWRGSVGRSDAKGAAALEQVLKPASTYDRDPWHGVPLPAFISLLVALGQRVTIGRYDNPEFAEPPRQIIGIVGDVRDRGLSRLPTAMMYMPQSQIRDAITTLNASVSPITWAIRTKVEPYSLTTSIQRELREASTGLPVSRIRSMGRVAVQSTAGSDFNLILLLTFAALAVLLAAVGIYGLMAYSVQQRTQEIGIRIALGAGIRDVRNMIVFQGMRLALIGIALGIFVALGVTRLMASLVFGVKTTDPIVFMAGATLLGGVALIAAYVPARRASRIDPLDALRHE